MLELFLAFFGAFQLITGMSEILVPFISFSLWKKWVFHRFFPVHGVVLIAAGFPFIFFKGYLSGFLFWIGILMTFSGPFLLIYPEKVRDAFSAAEKSFKKKDLRNMVYIDAFLRLLAGIFIIIAYLKTTIL